MLMAEVCKAVDDLLTPAEVGRRLGITPQRVVQLANDRRLACTMTRFGRLFDLADVEDFEHQRRAPERAAA
jgi:excisionase family DNA binding protein